MRINILFLAILFLVVNLSAQSQNATKFPCVGIVVQAPDSEDSSFVAAAIRQELIRAGKITTTDKGDILIARLIVQCMKSSFGRNGKWGEVSLSIVSKNGHAAGTGRRYVSSSEGSIYYKIIQDLAKETAGKFEYIK